MHSNIYFGPSQYKNNTAPWNFGYLGRVTNRECDLSFNLPVNFHFNSVMKCHMLCVHQTTWHLFTNSAVAKGYIVIFCHWHYIQRTVTLRTSYMTPSISNTYHLFLLTCVWPTYVFGSLTRLNHSHASFYFYVCNCVCHL